MGIHSVMPYDVKTAAPGNAERSCIATDGSSGPAALATKRMLVLGGPPDICCAEFTTRRCMVGAPYCRDAT
jgi:hypothetical protein